MGPSPAHPPRAGLEDPPQRIPPDPCGRPPAGGVPEPQHGYGRLTGILTRHRLAFGRAGDRQGVGWATPATQGSARERGPDTLTTVPIAAIALDFDPVLDLGGVTIRLQAIALTAGILLALAWTALAARRSGLRADDLLFLAVAAVPGAVVGGRLGHVLDHADYYAANPGAVLDPGQGGASLALAVVGGALTAGIIARLLGAPVRAWLHLAAVPTLLAIGIGKLAMALAGSGQGRPSDDPWATAYVGPGPWGSLAPDVASHPAQVYEALVALAVAAALALALAAGLDRARSGRAFLAGVGLWALGRAAIGATWRDAAVLGPLGAEQLQSLALAAGSLLVALLPVPEPDGRDDASAPGEGAPAWPDPVSRPRF